MQTLEKSRSSRFLAEANRPGRKLLGELPVVAGGAVAALLGGFIAYHLLADREAPQIESLDYKERVEKGQTQEISVCARERNPSEYATLRINGTSIALPLAERTGGRACYSASFDPSKYFSREGVVSGELTLTDNSGNSTSKQLSFLANLEAPKIEDVKVERIDLGKYRISVAVRDENLEAVVLVFDDRRLLLGGEEGKFEKIVDTTRDLSFTLSAVDKFNMTSTYQGSIEFSRDNPNAAYAIQGGLDPSYLYLVAPLDEDRAQDLNERQFVDLLLNNTKLLAVPTFLRYVKEKAEDGTVSDEELKYSGNFATFVEKVYNIIDEIKYRARVSNPVKTIDYSSSLGLRLGLDKEVARDATIEAISYYGIAVVDRKLPENFDEISLLAKATQVEKYGDHLVDFSPVVFPSIERSDFVLVPDVGRETWMLAKHLKMIRDSGFNILNHPEMFESLNVKVIANAYSIFDAPYGIAYAEKFMSGRELKPTDEDVIDLMMLQWNLYSNKAPQLGGGEKLYNRDFPWYDSDKLDVLYQDPNNRRQALLFLFFLDNATFDMKSAKVVAGLEGAKTALLQAEESYETISRLYPNGTVLMHIRKEPADVRSYFYGWVTDRGFHGLGNTHMQFVGTDPRTLTDIIAAHPLDFQNYIKDFNGIDQYLTKNWEYWDLMKFAMGYKRWHYVKEMIEIMMINYTIPQTLKAFGFPTYFVYIDPKPVGAARYEWIVSLPDYVADELRNGFGDKIIIGPANGFGLYLCKEGLIKDGVKEIFGFFGGTALYKSKIYGTIMANLGLASNFKFYLMRR